MTFTSEQKQFIENMEIDAAKFIALGRDIQILMDIAEDYELHKNGLLDEAGYIANKLQRCKAVHSVRSRVKDTSHLIEKIIRKWGEESVLEKYDTISKDNYKTIITDLIGVRAIYLFKNDWSTVHNHIHSKWTLKDDEKVVIYYRNGDDRSLYDNFDDCEQKIHKSGYRSIHYIIPATKIDGQQLYCEVQTRTIFEEGWSEIDHKVRYPSFSKNEYLKEFLDIFNRVAGSADEMGSFVNSLRELIEINNFLEKSEHNIAAKYNVKIKELEKKVDELISKEAESKEIKKAYDELKKIHDEKQNSLVDIWTTSIPARITKEIELEKAREASNLAAGIVNNSGMARLAKASDLAKMNEVNNIALGLVKIWESTKLMDTFDDGKQKKTKE